MSAAAAAANQMVMSVLKFTYLFQETYDKNAYEHLHPTGPKHDYAYHTEAMDRAMTGGIDDVGLGVLFGLSTYKYYLFHILIIYI